MNAMNHATTFRLIESHTAGEPTRVIVEGGPDVGAGSMVERRTRFAREFDHYRRAVCNEPRGSEVTVGALLTPAVSEGATAGVIFFNNVGTLGMCGHGMMGVVATLAHLGTLGAGRHVFDTPAGPITATLEDSGAVRIDNVASYRHRKAVRLRLDSDVEVTGDVAWGGNWFFLVREPSIALSLDRARELTELTMRIMQRLAEENITGSAGEKIDHIELFGPPTDASIADSQNFVLCPGGAYDRSPCGTGTSAKVACLAADGKLAPGQRWRQQSIVGTVFEASYRLESGAVIPSIAGRAFVNGETTVFIDPRDPFAWGIQAR
jgi:4-hydroxyproline epimerase